MSRTIILKDGSFQLAADDVLFSKCPYFSDRTAFTIPDKIDLPDFSLTAFQNIFNLITDRSTTSTNTFGETIHHTQGLSNKNHLVEMIRFSDFLNIPSDLLLQMLNRAQFLSYIDELEISLPVLYALFQSNYVELAKGFADNIFLDYEVFNYNTYHKFKRRVRDYYRHKEWLYINVARHCFCISCSELRKQMTEPFFVKHDYGPNYRVWPQTSQINASITRAGFGKLTNS